MPALFQAVSRSVLLPFMERAWPSSREQEAFLRLNTNKSRTPQRRTRLLGGVEPGVRSQGLPKELRFQEPTNSRTLPRVSVKYLPGWTGAHPIKLEHYYFVPSNSIKVRGQIIPVEKGKLSVNREKVRGKNKADIDRKTPIKMIQTPQKTVKKLHERKLPEMRPSLAKLGEIRGPRNSKGLTSNMKRDFDLPNNWKKWQEPKSAPRYIRDSIYLANRTFRQEPSSLEHKDKKKPNTHSSGSAFKLGTQLKVHDYGFKKMKQRKSKNSGRKDLNDSPLSNVSDACSQRTFRSLSLSERSFARQTALDMFVKISKSYEERLASEVEQPQEPEDIDLTGESVWPVDFGSLDKLSISGETKSQSIENESCEIHTTLNFPQLPVPSDKKESQPSEILKQKIYTSVRRRSPVPQTDAETQTICACGICQFLNKSKAEKPPPLVVEMENNLKMLEQRNYYMENLRQATMKFNEESEKSRHSALPISMPMKSDYSRHRNHCIYDANHKDKINYLRDPKNISACYRNLIAVRPCETINHKTHRFSDYRAPNVANIFARCYHTLFEAEQRTNGILSSDCQENVCG